MKPVPITFSAFQNTVQDADGESAAAKLKARCVHASAAFSRAVQTRHRTSCAGFTVHICPELQSLGRASRMMTSRSSPSLAGQGHCATNYEKNDSPEKTTYLQDLICIVEMKWINKRSGRHGSVHRLPPRGLPLRRSPRPSLRESGGQRSLGCNMMSQTKLVRPGSRALRLHV